MGEKGQCGRKGPIGDQIISGFFSYLNKFILFSGIGIKGPQGPPGPAGPKGKFLNSSKISLKFRPTRKSRKSK